MRLICPNCGAQYEVDDAVIPEQGRDVQCSNCGHTWFQQSSNGGIIQADDDHDVEEAPEPEDEPTPEPERRGLDPEIASVLREEAEREAAARQSDGLETQPDLGIEDTDGASASRTAAARARMARLRGLDEASPEAEAAIAGLAATAGSRKELLPDVEEVSSSLEPEEKVAETVADEEFDDDDIEPRRPGGARRFMFRLILLAVILGILVYYFAPQIIEYVPQAEPYLIKYVDWANGVRDQISQLLSTAVERVNGLISG